MKITGKINFSAVGRADLKRVLTVLSSIGIICGVLTVCFSGDLLPLCRIRFTGNIFKAADRNFIRGFFTSFLPLAFILMIQFFSGLFALGQAAAVIAAVYRGFVTGVSSALFYLVYGFKGALLTALSLVLSVTGILVSVYGAREAFIMSGMTARPMFFGSMGADPSDTRLYIIKFTVLLAAAFAASVIDTALTYLLKGI